MRLQKHRRATSRTPASSHLGRSGMTWSCSQHAWHRRCPPWLIRTGHTSSVATRPLPAHSPTEPPRSLLSYSSWEASNRAQLVAATASWVQRKGQWVSAARQRRPATLCWRPISRALLAHSWLGRAMLLHRPLVQVRRTRALTCFQWMLRQAQTTSCCSLRCACRSSASSGQQPCAHVLGSAPD
jgi:hypothetical protein